MTKIVCTGSARFGLGLSLGRPRRERDRAEHELRHVVAEGHDRRRRLARLVGAAAPAAAITRGRARTVVRGHRTALDRTLRLGEGRKLRRGLGPVLDGLYLAHTLRGGPPPLGPPRAAARSPGRPGRPRRLGLDGG